MLTNFLCKFVAMIKQIDSEANKCNFIDNPHAQGGTWNPQKEMKACYVS